MLIKYTYTLLLLVLISSHATHAATNTTTEIATSRSVTALYSSAIEYSISSTAYNYHSSSRPSVSSSSALLSSSHGEYSSSIASSTDHTSALITSSSIESSSSTSTYSSSASSSSSSVASSVASSSVTSTISSSGSSSSSSSSIPSSTSSNTSQSSSTSSSAAITSFTTTSSTNSATVVLKTITSVINGKTILSDYYSTIAYTQSATNTPNKNNNSTHSGLSKKNRNIVIGCVVGIGVPLLIALCTVIYIFCIQSKKTDFIDSDGKVVTAIQANKFTKWWYSLIGKDIDEKYATTSPLGTSSDFEPDTSISTFSSDSPAHNIDRSGTVHTRTTGTLPLDAHGARLLDEEKYLNDHEDGINPRNF